MKASQAAMPKKSHAVERDLLLGQLCVGNKFATKEQLEECLASQLALEKQGGRKSIGDLLLEKGYITEQQLESALELQQFVELRRQDRLLGRWAVRNGMVTLEHMKMCLDTQLEERRAGGTVSRIAEIALTRGYVTMQQANTLRQAQQRLSESIATERVRPVEFIRVDCSEECLQEFPQKSSQEAYALLKLTSTRVQLLANKLHAPGEILSLMVAPPKPHKSFRASARVIWARARSGSAHLYRIGLEITDTDPGVAKHIDKLRKSGALHHLNKLWTGS